MCGIVAVLRRRCAPEVEGESLDTAALFRSLAEASRICAELDSDNGASPSCWGPALERASNHLEELDGALRRPAGVRGLVRDDALRRRLVAEMDGLSASLSRVELALDAGSDRLPAAALESLNAGLVRLKDAAWAVARDRVAAAERIDELARGKRGDGTIDGLYAIHLVLSALDRLEVRGRDSAGLHVVVGHHGLDLESAQVRRLLAARADHRLFTNGVVRVCGGNLGFVYKAAAEIGKLGDNGAALRAALRNDELLSLALESDDVEVAVLGHTRWASVGLINETNAHPVNEVELDGSCRHQIVAALNGDVDNFADLKATEGLRLPAEITTDAKVIPVLVARRLGAGAELEEAFRETVASFEGSVAIAALDPSRPDRLLLAQRGSGQALYVGVSDLTFMVASEPYGLVEETPTYLRLDGETPGNPENPSASRGQVVVLRRDLAGEIEGIGRLAYDGTRLPVAMRELQRAEITTRDVDRGDFPHFLLKEISEAPVSCRKTLRGKIRSAGDELQVVLPPATLPPELLERLASGSLDRVLVIGQGTAAVAGQGIATAILDQVGDALRVESLPATELSGFGLRDDMSDTLVVAVSQSGTTTDTNRTVDLVRGRGAAVVAIVNRRNSDLIEKSDGVLYTSDGRDVEMSVASTKAFYSQIAAGFLLAVGLAQVLGERAGRTAKERTALLQALRQLPEAMERVLAEDETIARVAARQAPSKRYWALVGNGPNRTAAEEIRIKLSELCYKSIACDVTEDKKHIDLSSEPLILVCAAGLQGSTADDVAKEVAIYRAHKATPIVIASEGETRFASAIEHLSVPRLHPALDFVLSTVVGHLFGYRAALAIDAQAHPLREARSAIDRLASAPQPEVGASDLLERLRPAIEPAAQTFFQKLREGALNGHLEASTASRLASLLRYVSGLSPLDSYAAEYGKPGTPGVVVEDLTAALTQAIDELTRPIDAIKHQAKTVTVGISRTDEGLFTVPLVRELFACGTDRDHVGYGDLRTLAALDSVVQRVLGYTRYRIDGDPREDDCAVHVVDHGGISRDLVSRTERQPVLRGTKRLVAMERQLLAARGRSDGRTVVLVPEVSGRAVVGLTLLHVQYRERATAGALRGVLGGYRRRYAALRDVVMETEPSFREDLLESFTVAELLCDPINILAERFRGSPA